MKLLNENSNIPYSINAQHTLRKVLIVELQRQIELITSMKLDNQERIYSVFNLQVLKMFQNCNWKFTF